ncbi:MAG: S8 family peptidase [Candidatus Paceibacterota bacterium]
MLSIVLLLPALSQSTYQDKMYILTVKNGRVSEEYVNNNNKYQCTSIKITSICGLNGYVRLQQEASTTANDTNEQWALDKLQYKDIISMGYTGTGVTIAVIDTGVDSSHNDLKEVVLPGYDAINEKYGVISDDNGHGTHVAGVIAAQDNLIGVNGLAPGVKILPVKVLDRNGDGEEKDVAKGILWALDQKVDIINLSLGGDQDNALLRSAVERAIAAGVVVVASSGNDGALFNKVTYPASLPGVLAVAASDPSDSVAFFSNYGEYVDVAAPGVFINSTWINGLYRQESGTSMAAPYVSASIALLMSALKVSASRASELLILGATDIESSGFDKKSGHGLIDPYAVLLNKYPRNKKERVSIEYKNLPTIPEIRLIWPNLPLLELPDLQPYPLPKIKPFPKPDFSQNPMYETTPKVINTEKPKNPAKKDIRMKTKLTVKRSISGEKYTYLVTLSTENGPLPLRSIRVKNGYYSRVVHTNNRGQIIIKSSKPTEISVIYKGDKTYRDSLLIIKK